MSVTVSAVRDYLEERIPTALKMEFDNVGLLCGRGGREVERVLTALDITPEVIDEAERIGAGLIVSHHPLFFELKRINDEDPTGEKLLALAERGIAAICLHTNLDAVCGGVNDALAETLGANVIGPLDPKSPITRLTQLPSPMLFSAFLPFVKEALHANGLRYHDAGRTVQELAVCGGSGAGDLPLAVAAGCDTFVTADVKHHQFLLAKEYGINLIDAGHFSTENVAVPVLARWLKERFPELDVRIATALSQPEKYFV